MMFNKLYNYKLFGQILLQFMESETKQTEII